MNTLDSMNIKPAHSVTPSKEGSVSGIDSAMTPPTASKAFHYSGGGITSATSSAQKPRPLGESLAVDALFNQVGDVDKIRRRTMMEMQETQNIIKLLEDKTNIITTKLMGQSARQLDAEREIMQLEFNAQNHSRRYQEGALAVERALTEEPVLMAQAESKASSKKEKVAEWTKEKAQLPLLEQMWPIDPKAALLKESIRQVDEAVSDLRDKEQDLTSAHREAVEKERLRILEAASKTTMNVVAGSKNKHSNSSSSSGGMGEYDTPKMAFAFGGGAPMSPSTQRHHLESTLERATHSNELAAVHHRRAVTAAEREVATLEKHTNALEGGLKETMEKIDMVISTTEALSVLEQTGLCPNCQPRLSPAGGNAEAPDSPQAE